MQCTHINCGNEQQSLLVLYTQEINHTSLSLHSENRQLLIISKYSVRINLILIDWSLKVSLKVKLFQATVSMAGSLPLRSLRNS